LSKEKLDTQEVNTLDLNGLEQQNEQTSKESCELSIVMPCLNEAQTIGQCIQKARTFLYYNNIDGEIIVADNGSTDDSVNIAKKLGAKVVNVEERGYGAALMGGIAAAKGKYVIIGDSDDSYDFLNLMPFLEKLREGYHLVVGNRFKAGIQKGAMPFLHRYLGNPILSGIGKLFFKSKVNDFHCGLRGFHREAYKWMDLHTTGMEFASEMVVKSIIYDLKMTEVPTTLSPLSNKRKSHLRPFNDGWRHLKFLLLYSPRWIFFYPGLFLMIAGFLVSTWIFFNPQLSWDIHTMLYASGAIMIGFQTVIFAVFTKTFAVHEKLLPTTPQIEKILKNLTLEKGLVTGGIMVLLGLGGFIYSLIIWNDRIFFEAGITITMRLVIASVTLLVLGFQLIFSSFFFHMLRLNTK
jgi:glycosyltransferase involved in cell wall biosynthesis